MERRMTLASWGLIAGLTVLISSCGGSGGGGGSTSSGAVAPTPLPTLAPGEPTRTFSPTRTPTPLSAGSSRNETTESSDAGSITLRFADIVIFGGQSTLFSVFLHDANGQPVANAHITLLHGDGVTAQPEDGLTRADGSLNGTIGGVFGGGFTITATTDAGPPFNGLAANLTIVVSAPAQRTPSATGGVVATPTLTPEPCRDVQTIIVQTDTPNISSQIGGTANITAVVFDSNNLPVGNVNILFDVQPRIGSFNPLVKATADGTGIVQTQLRIPANSNFGTLTVSAAACGKMGNVDVNIVSGVSTKPVTTVVLQADPATVGNLTGGTVNLTAAVLDSDNAPINGIDVLFITTVGKANPLVNRTKASGSQNGIATSIVQIPADTKVNPYTINAVAGGVTGATIINVVPGRVGPGGINTDVPSGEPAAITLGSSPTRIQVAGTGGTELATVIGRVFDNNGNPLPNVRVHYHVVAAQSAPGAVILPVTTPTPSGSPVPIPTTLCAPDDPVSISDTAGFAVIQLRSGSQPGPVTVSACTDTIIREIPAPLSAQQALVTVSSGPVDHVTVTINGKSVDNNDGTLTTTVSAIVNDAQGNVVEDGTPVFFEILARDANDPAHSVVISSNSSTNAAPPCDTSQFIIQTGLPISPQPGNAISCIKYPEILQASEIQIRASVGGKNNGNNGQALPLPGILADLEASINPSTVTVSNEDDGLAIVHVAASDVHGDGVENVRVRFSASVGTIDRSILTDANGEADATLTIPAGTLSGSAGVRITAGGLQIPNVPVTIVNQAGSITPTPIVGSGPAAIRFVIAQPVVIGVRGSGLPEQSVLTFQVTDASGMPAANVPVHFSIGRVADESITPAQGVTDASGNVQVTVKSGKRALSAQVTAQVTSVSPALTTRSTQVNILGGPPSLPNFSLAHQFHNISGAVTFGLTNTVTAFVADRFGNPVPPGTAVNFTTKGGSVGDPNPTGTLGQATATLVSQAPVPGNGTVSTLATTNGERPFIDTNGNGVCDDDQDELLPIAEPYFDTNCNGVHDTGEDFIDLNSNGLFDADQGSGVPACADQVVVFSSICSTFSAGTVPLLIPDGVGPIQAGGSRGYTLIVSDNPDPLGNPGVGNPIVGGSQISVTVSGTRGRVIGLTSFGLPDAFTNDRIIDGLSRFQFAVVDNDPHATIDEIDGVNVNISSSGLPAGGNGSVTTGDTIVFLAAPTPTPTDTPTPTFTVTATPTPLPPVIAPIQSTLSAGTGAPPTSCNGASQTFIVTGGAPPFTVTGGGGCISVASVPASGGTFLFTAGNLLGNYTITITDAVGKTASAGVAIEGPPTPTTTETLPPTNTVPPTITPTPTPAAAFIQLDLLENQASPNGDGTFSTVISALVTTSTGSVVGDNVAVQFSLVNPAAGASVISPGLTNQAAPCTLGFTVVPQPGDALSCIKYGQDQAGTTVTVRAQVATGPGTFITTQRAIVLPDLRPTATPTVTNTPMPTSTATFTSTPTETFTPTPTITQTPSLTPVDTSTPTVTATGTPVPPPGSIQFLGATPAAIGVRGSGLAEQSVLTFQVNNTLGSPIAGIAVQFALTGTGSESLNPLFAISDQNGQVTTAVTSGTQAASVRVVASLATNPLVSAQSTAVSILGAPPAFNHFSLAPALQNVAGRVSFGIQDNISAFVNDRFGNAVPPGTAVSFITNAASVVNQTTTTVSGVATATLLTEGIVPPSGIVTVMAFTHGEESFLDNNGNGIFDAGDTVLTDDLPEPFIDFRPFPPADAACTISAPSAACNDRFDTGTAFERFLDTNNNGVWDSVATTGIGQGTHLAWDKDVLIFGTTSVTFSGPLVTPVLASCSLPPCNGFNLPNGQSMSFTINVHDDLMNPLVGGSTIAISSTGGTISGGAITIPDTQSFNQLIPQKTQFTFVLSDADVMTNSPTPAAITVTINSPNGSGTLVIASGTVN